MFSVFLGTHLGVELLGLWWFLTFWQTAKLFSKVTALFYFPPATCESFHFFMLTLLKGFSGREQGPRSGNKNAFKNEEVDEGLVAGQLLTRQRDLRPLLWECNDALLLLLLKCSWFTLLVSGGDNSFLDILKMSEILGPINVYFKIGNGTNILEPELSPCHLPWRRVCEGQRNRGELEFQLWCSELRIWPYLCTSISLIPSLEHWLRIRHCQSCSIHKSQLWFVFSFPML